MESPKVLAQRLGVGGSGDRRNSNEQRKDHPMGGFGVQREEQSPQHMLPEQVAQWGHRVCIVAVRRERGKAPLLWKFPQLSVEIPGAARYRTRSGVDIIRAIGI